MLFKVRRSFITSSILILALLSGMFNPASTQPVSAAKLTSGDSQRRGAYNTTATISPDETVRVSVDSKGVQTDRPSYSNGSSISADGRYITFSSDATNLVPGDANAATDVFVHDLQTGLTMRVSVDSNGTQANGASYAASISANGRYVTFYSGATNLVSVPTSGVFVHDLQSGLTTLISTDSSGVPGNASSTYPVISADGRYIAFQSYATNLVPGDTNGTGDIFVHDVQTGTTTRVSVDSTGLQTDRDSSSASISSDGRYIAFTSGATNLVAIDTNGVGDVFVHDMQTGATTRVSVDSNGLQANLSSDGAFISSDGRYIGFISYATNLVPGDTNGASDAFLHDTQIGTTIRVSVASNDVQGNGNSSGRSISSDGRYVAFSSSASNLVSGDNNGIPDMFVRDMQTGMTTRVSVDSNGAEENNASDNGASGGSLSGDGQYIVFQTGSTNLVPGDTNSVADIFVHRQNILSTPTPTPADTTSTATPTITSTNTPTSTPTYTPTFIPTRTSTNTPTYTPTSVPPLFNPYVNFPVGAGQLVAIGDFNSDGLQDVALTLSANGTSPLLILLQSSDGSLASPISYDAGYQPESMEVGDLNHDGRTDIVVANYSSNTISIFFQQPSGLFASRTIFATDSGPDAVAVGDLNNDGLDDIALSYWTASSIGVFTQTNTGTLNPMIEYSSPQAGYDDIAIADINNDGRNDVIKMNGQGRVPNLAVYLQNGNGTLDSALFYSVMNCGSFCLSHGIDVGDVTGDGLTDIVVSYGGNRSTSKIAVFAQAQDGSLQLPISYDAYDIPKSVAVADVNQDSLADVLVLHDGWERLSLFTQQANGALNPYTLYNLPPYGYYEVDGLAVGDINHDGLLDVAIADYNNGLVILYHAPSSIPNPPTPTRVPTFTPTLTPTNASTPTSTPTFTPTDTPTNTPTYTPTFTPTFTPTLTPTSSPLLFSDDFESGDLSKWTSVTGLTVQQQQVYGGVYAARQISTSAVTWAYKQLSATQPTIYYDLHFKIISMASSVNLLKFRTATGTSILGVYVNTSGKLAYRNDAGNTTVTSTTKVTSGVWHDLQARTSINGVNSQVEVWLDGVHINTLSKTETLGTTPIGRIQLGDNTGARTYDVALDDVKVSTNFIGTPSSTPTVTNTPTRTPSPTIAFTPTFTKTFTPTITYTPTPTKTFTPTPTSTAILMATATVGPSFTPTNTPTSTSTSTRTPTSTATFTNTATATSTSGPSATSTNTLTSAPTFTPTPTSTYTPTAVVTATSTSGSLLFSDNFESGDLSKWTSVTGLIGQQQEVYDGAYAARQTSTSAATWAYKQLDSTQNQLYYRIRFKIISQGANSVYMLKFRTATGASILGVYVNSTGKLAYRNDAGSTTVTSTTNVTSGVWHDLQVRAVINGTNSQIEVWLDGIHIDALSKTEVLGTTSIGRVQLGDNTGARIYDVALDDVEVSTNFIVP